MRWFKTAVIVLIALFIVSVAGIFMFLSANGRVLFMNRVSSLTNRQVSIGAVRPVFPMGLEIEGLVIEGILITSRAQLSVDPWALLQGTLAFSSVRLQDPAFFLERNADAVFLLPSTDSGTVREDLKTAAASPKPAGKPRNVVLRKLVIDNGALYVSDEQSLKEWTIDKIHGVVENIPLTGSSLRTRLFVTASLVRLNVPFVDRDIDLRGWVNWAARDMDVVAQAMGEGGKMGLDARLVSRANDLLVEGRARLSGRQEREAQGKAAGAMENAALGILSALAADVDVKFSFRTEMDRFDIKKVSLSGNVAMDNSLEAVSGKIVGGLTAAGTESVKPGEAQKKP